MQNLFGALFFISLIALAITVLKPGFMNRITRQNLSRKRWLGILGGSTLLFFILIGVAAPNTTRLASNQETNTGAVNQTADNRDQARETENYTYYRVNRVIDGDTFEVNIGGKEEKVRLIGIDTAETVDPRKSVECFGKEAAEEASRRMLGNSVSLEADPSAGDRDRYGRLLRYAFFEDRNDVGKLMIKDGYAHEYTYDRPYKYKTDYEAVEREAREAKRGLWADNVCASSPAPMVTPSSNSQASPPAQQKPQSITTTPTPAAVSSSTSSGDKDCKDFATQSQAQTYFNANGGSKTNNFNRLDGNDRDGIVCESLP